MKTMISIELDTYSNGICVAYETSQHIIHFFGTAENIIKFCNEIIDLTKKTEKKCK